MKQLRSKRLGSPRKSIRFNLNDASEAHLESLKRFYQVQLGQEVSTSLIVRRAFEGLLEHVSRLKDQQARRDEVLILVRHVR